MNISYVDAARDELARAVDYLSVNGRPGTPEALLDEIDNAENFIREFPNASVRVYKSTRRYLLTRFPYQLVYRLEGDEIVIYAVAHQSRRPGYWRKRIPPL